MGGGDERKEEHCRAGALIALLLLASLPGVIGNDPGHDTLYVVKTGDSNVTGSINVTDEITSGNVRYATLLYGDLLDIRANGTILSPTSRPAIQATTNSLYLDGNGNLYLNTRAGTTGIIQMGSTSTNDITLNVSGTIRQQDTRVCLENGTNCPGTLSESNVSGSGTTNHLARWTAPGAVGTSILYDDGTRIGINTEAPEQTLDVHGTVHINASDASFQVTNATVSHLFINGTAGRVGIGTITPQATLDINGSLRAESATTPELCLGGECRTTWPGGGNVSAGSTSTDHAIARYDGTTGLLIQSSPVTIDDTGNIAGIGTLASGAITSTGSSSFGSGTTINAQPVCLGNGANCPSTLTGANVTGSGTSGTITKWTSTGSIGNSIISESGGTLTVNGNLSMPANFWIGNGAVSNNTNTIALGTNAQASGASAIAIGPDARSTQFSGIAIGAQALTTNAGVAIGASSYASGGAAIGANANSSQGTAIAAGSGAKALQIGSSAFGANANATNTGATAIGLLSLASGAYSIALGYNSDATATRATAIGYEAFARHDDSVAIGYRAETSAANQLAIGNTSAVLNTVIHGSVRANSSAATGSLVIGNDTSTHLFINGSTGNVGVGTTSPDGVQVGVAVIEAMRATDNVRIGVASGTPRIMLEDNASPTLWEIDNANGDLRIYNPGVVRLLIQNSTGDVGIGTSTPTGDLHLYGLNTSDTAITIGQNGTSPTGCALNIGMGGASFEDGSAFINTRACAGGEPNLRIFVNNTPAIMINATTRNVGIGTTSPARTLHVHDTMRIQPRSSAPSSPAEGDLYYDSDIHALCIYNSTAWVATAGSGACA